MAQFLGVVEMEESEKGRPTRPNHERQAGGQ